MCLNSFSSPMDVTELFIPNTGLHISSYGNLFNCIVCNNNVSSAEHLTLHYVLVHQMMHCARCAVLFIDNNHLETHIKLIHSIERCLLCSEEFPGVDHLITHQTEVHSIHCCKICCERLDTADRLMQHLTEQHRVLPNIDASSTLFVKLKCDVFFCRLCLLRYPFRKFIDHFVLHHGFPICVLLARLNSHNSNSLDALWTSLSTELNPGSSQCPVCDQDFTARVPMVLHRVFCAGEKYCDGCEKIFADENIFMEHKRGCDQIKEVDKCANDEETAESSSSPLCKPEIQHNTVKPPTMCTLCTFDKNNWIKDINSLTEHYVECHKLSTTCLLAILNSMHQSSKKDVNDIKNNIYNIIADSPPEADSDFDTRMVKFVYSSFDDTSSDEEGAPSTRRLFICTICEHKAVSKLALINHMNKVHGLAIRPVEFWCKICKRKYSNLLGLRKHNRKVHRKPHKCCFCLYECESRRAMR